MSVSSPDLQSVDQLVARGISLLKNGDATEARVYLAEALHSMPTNSTAWLWLASAVTTNAERRYCLEQALAADAGNAAARRALATIPARVAALPPAEFSAALHAAPAIQPVFTAHVASEPHLTAITAPPVMAIDPLLALLPSRFSASPNSMAAVQVAVLPAAARHERDDLRLVLDGFSKHLDHDQICRVLCEQRGYGWDGAHALVARVEREYGGTIARRQLPLFLLFGTIMLLVGCFLTVVQAASFYEHLMVNTVINPRLLLSFGSGLVMVFGSLGGMAYSIKGALHTQHK